MYILNMIDGDFKKMVAMDRFGNYIESKYMSRYSEISADTWQSAHK